MMIYSPDNPEKHLKDQLWLLLSNYLPLRDNKNIILLALYIKGALKVYELKQLLKLHNQTISNILPALLAAGYVVQRIETKPLFFCNRTNNVKITLWAITPAGETYLKTALQLS